MVAAVGLLNRSVVELNIPQPTEATTNDNSGGILILVELNISQPIEALTDGGNSNGVVCL